MARFGHDFLFFFFSYSTSPISFVSTRMLQEPVWCPCYGARDFLNVMHRELLGVPCFFMGFIFGVLQDGWGVQEGWDDFQLWLCKRIVEEEAQAKLEISIEREMPMAASMPSPQTSSCAKVCIVLIIVLRLRKEQSTRYKKRHSVSRKTGMSTESQ